jgi:formylglycine-generating enzyme required for sulfatase activity
LRGENIIKEYIMDKSNLRVISKMGFLIVFLVSEMIVFSSCTDSNERRIEGTWTDVEDSTWVFSSDGKITYTDKTDGSVDEYQYSVFDGEQRTELTIFRVIYDAYIMAGVTDQKYNIEFSKDRKTLRLTGGQNLNGWSVAGPGWSTNQLIRTGTKSGQKNGSTTKKLVGKREIRKAKAGMVSIPGGSFEMGTPEGTPNSDRERPVQKVTLSGFKMSKYPVTQEQYQAVMGSNPSGFASNPADGEVQERRPVENVNWYDAIVFCNKLSINEGLSPAYRISGSTNPSDWGDVPRRGSDQKWDAVEIVSGSKGYRLPTEAQWEYAAKGGKGSPKGYTYSGSNTIDDVTWYADNSGEKTHEVGKKKANNLGLYDMSGNVWEWCWDWFGVYPSGSQTDPYGAVSGDFRVLRGGGWGSSAENVRSANRSGYDPYYRSYGSGGFRLVRP